MKVLIVTDQRFIEKDGRYYTESVFNNNIERYKNIFGEVSVYAKTGKVMFPSCAEVCETKVFLGGTNFELYTKKNVPIFKKIVDQYDLLILRVPSILSHQIASIAQKKKIPYLITGVGCAFDAFWNHGIIGKFLAPIQYLNMKRTVKNATYAIYVTKKFLQKRYPTDVKSAGISDVKIDTTEKDILTRRLEKIENMSLKSPVIMTAAALNVRYKGQEYVIKALKKLKQKGIYAKYYVAGTGDSKYLCSVAEKQGVLDQVVVLGSVPHEKIIQLMDETDIYIQPSLQEGLPRAVVEAMSRGCPCIGTKTGGIPELLPAEGLVNRKSVNDIADRIEKFLDQKYLKNIAKINYQNSLNYTEEALNKQRTQYFEYVVSDLTQRKK